MLHSHAPDQSPHSGESVERNNLGMPSHQTYHTMAKMWSLAGLAGQSPSDHTPDPLKEVQARKTIQAWKTSKACTIAACVLRTRSGYIGYVHLIPSISFPQTQAVGTRRMQLYCTGHQPYFNMDHSQSTQISLCSGRKLQHEQSFQQ